MTGTDKNVLVARIVAQLTQERETYAAAARAAHAEATHEQSRADNKYDTRGLEAAYLARGQSRQVAETEQAIEQYHKLSPLPFLEGAPIDLGALVELGSGKRRTVYFLGPCAGGTEVALDDGLPCLVITPQSPLGRQLIGRRAGEKLALEIAGERRDLRVMSVV